MRVWVPDDGMGAAVSGLISARDGVASAGGEIQVHRPRGGGTRVAQRGPDSHRPAV
ncbi:hypothetical protein ACQEVF_48585 [Nonomuraea polychroma]|uniref:hypothetical protein n=1 Tax=Nonomuraea polychroma TaxID=46176 RepID=UPI003D8C2A99